MSWLTVYSLLPPRDVIEDAVRSYFQYCHKQPLWLFDREESFSIQDCREETLFSILALSLCHSKHPFSQGRLDELSQSYAQAARERIMQRVGEGKVSLSTIQNLCVLALANIQGQFRDLMMKSEKYVLNEFYSQQPNLRRSACGHGSDTCEMLQSRLRDL